MKYLVIICILVLTTYSCDPLELPTTQRIIVIEAYIDDIIQKQSVSIGLTNAYSEENNLTPITDATVQIVSSSGDHFSFEHQDGGVYISTLEFGGIAGRSYSLIVLTSDGDSLVSSAETMLSPILIDSLWFEEVEAENITFDIAYFPVISSLDDASEENYYRYQLYQNAEYLSDPEFVFLNEDEFFNGKSFKEEFRSVQLFEGDKIKVRVSKISREVYDYFKLLREQTIAIGTNQGSSPSPIYGNIQNSQMQQVLGIFSVSAISESEITIDPS